MRRLLNTLFILNEETYLALENENVIVKKDEEILGKVPLLTLENILYFGYKGVNRRMCQKENRDVLFVETR